MVDVFARTLRNDWTADWLRGEEALSVRVQAVGKGLQPGAPAAAADLLEAVGEVNVAALMAAERYAAKLRVAQGQISAQQEEMRRQATLQASGGMRDRIQGFLGVELAGRRLAQAQSRTRQVALSIVGNGEMLARLERIDPSLGKVVRAMGKFEAEKPAEFEPKAGPGDYVGLVTRYRDAVLAGDPKEAARVSRDRALLVKALVDDPVSLARLNAGLDVSAAQVLFQDLESMKAAGDPTLARNDPGVAIAQRLLGGLPDGSPEARYAALRRQLEQEKPGLTDMGILRGYETALGNLGRAVAGNPSSIAILSTMDGKMAEMAIADGQVARALGAMASLNTAERDPDYLDLVTRYRDALLEGKASDASVLEKSRMALVRSVYADRTALVKLSAGLGEQARSLFEGDLARYQAALKPMSEQPKDMAKAFAEEVLASLKGLRPEEKYLALEKQIGAEKGKGAFGVEEMTRMRGFEIALKAVSKEVTDDAVALSKLGGRNPKQALIAVANAALDGVEANILPPHLRREETERAQPKELTEMGVMRDGVITRGSRETPTIVDKTTAPAVAPEPKGPTNVVQLDGARDKNGKVDPGFDRDKAMRIPLESAPEEFGESFRKMRTADLLDAYKATDALAKEIRANRAMSEDDKVEHDKLELARRGIGEELVGRGAMKKDGNTPEMMLSKRGQETNQRVTAAQKEAYKKSLRPQRQGPSALGEIKDSAARGMRTGSAIARGAAQMLG